MALTKVSYSMIENSPINVIDYGAIGDGVTDDTSALQNALDAGTNLVQLQSNATYKITAITIPENITLISNGAVFRKSAASSTYAITINGEFTTESLILSSPGSSSDNGIKISGSNVNIEHIEATSDAVDSNYGIHIESPTTSAITNININSTKVANYKSSVQIYNVTDSNFNNFDVTSYVTGVYFRDAQRISCNNAYIRTMSPSATGSAGQNGLLIESYTANGSSTNLKFTGWAVVNSAEHAYRLGGYYTIANVWFTNCRSALSGYAGSGATGGSGFKVLGDTTYGINVHENIYFNNCLAQDISTTGTGIGNFSGFLISLAENVHLSNCTVSLRSNTYSSQWGIYLESVTGVYLTNVNATDCKQHAIRINAAVSQGAPASYAKIEDVIIVGGQYSINASGSPVVQIEGSDGVYTNIETSGINLSGGYAAVRGEPSSGSGSYSNCYFSLAYSNPQDTTGGPPIEENNVIVFDCKSPWYGLYQSTGANASIFRDVTNGLVKIRKAGAWVTL